MGKKRLRYVYSFSVLTLFFFMGLYFKKMYLTTNLPDVKRYPDKNPVLPSATRRHQLVPPYPYPYKFIMDLQGKCQGRNPFLVLLVASVSHDLDSRMAVRETWGNESNYGDVDVVTVFLVGLSPVMTDKGQKRLEEENSIYGDIVQQDFMDTYYNLTLKTLMGIEWVAKYCPTASYVMKTDVDIFLNVEYLVYSVLLPGSPVHKNFFTGRILENRSPNRDNDDKWYVPQEIYPNNLYPPYCSGSGYVFSVDMTQKIYDTAQVIEMMPMEDVFIGLCLNKLKISITEPLAGIFNGIRKEYNRCLYNKLVTIHYVSGNILRVMWRDFWSQKNSGCPD
ncbi:hypothetical protein GDO86_018183 [Hymenochirus boettgeri]|uniref:Hexosyltransferase n=1 Tax=Hymenochirus boettgeri TaxID=247094 RepID=A0A8T2IL52_9PIPI|nr:hypothetical protein GDO86_018183 [Hymenochirus boettgeri]